MLLVDIFLDYDTSLFSGKALGEIWFLGDTSENTACSSCSVHSRKLDHGFLDMLTLCFAPVLICFDLLTFSLLSVHRCL